jgi:hypothetical protein
MSESSSSSWDTSWPSALNLTRRTTLNYDRPGGTPAHRQVITAAAEGAEDAAIFVFQVETINPLTGERGWFFSNVCSLSDYQGLPSAPPGEEDEYLLFRGTELDLVHLSITEMEYTWDQIQLDAAAFMAAVRSAANLDGNTETVNL